MTKRLGEEIPKHCHYWRFQGDHNMIGCGIDRTLCKGNSCNPEEVDPTGLLREKARKEKLKPN